MILYHGSNVQVAHPKILKKLRALDFGAGFYLTSSFSQATKWAKVVTKRNNCGCPTLNRYTFDENKSKSQRILFFETANADWLDFVVANRKGIYQSENFDIVIGPVANDATLPVIDDYMAGIYTKEEAVKRLLPQNLTDQYAFLSEAGLGLLTFQGSENT